MILEIFKMRNPIFVECCLTFPVFRVLVRCLAESRLSLDTWNQSGVQENVFGNQFSTFGSPGDHPHRISFNDVQRNRAAALGDPKVKISLTIEDRQNYGAIPTLMFAARPLTTSSKHPVDIPQNCVGQTAKTAIVGITIRQVPESIIILGVGNKIQNTGLKWL